MMKWARRTAMAMVVLIGALCVALIWTAQRPARPVGFQMVQVPDQHGQPFPVAIWYPTDAHPALRLVGAALMELARDAPVAGHALPLVVISHGNGGGPTSHADLALALASAGYIVAGPMHPGDNYADHSLEGTVPLFSERSSQIHVMLDYLLQHWRDRAAIAPGRIGAFGFSAGGLTVLTAIGAQPDLRLIATHCAHTPEFICTLFRQYKAPLLDPVLAQAGNHYSPDARIRAAVLAAPGLAFTLGPGAFDNVRIPVQLWSGERDRFVPYASNSALVRSGLGDRVDFHTVAGASHYSFLAPCGLLAVPALCSEEAGFDRAAFHVAMNASVLTFFNAHLPP